MQQSIEIKEITREDLSSWKANPVTQRYFAAVADLLKRQHIELGQGVTLDSSSADVTAIHTAGAIGFINGLKTCLDIEDIEDEGSGG